MRQVALIDLGRKVPYLKVIELMKSLVKNKIKQNSVSLITDNNQNCDSNQLLQVPDVLLLLEHQNIYTNGRRNKGKISQQELDMMHKLGATYFETERGGEITYHGTGQLVIYPILDLKKFNLGVREYVNKLEDSVIDLVAKLGINAFRAPEFPGVWVSDTKKIAATGCHIQRYISSHGIAINVETDLNMFKAIVPCGLHGKTATSVLEQLTQNHSQIPSQSYSEISKIIQDHNLFDSIKKMYLDSFSKVFDTQIVSAETEFPHISNLFKANL
ncbi:hypothetical protein BB561_006947 [Smittium simulii]|uniref:Octanoyltransferase n=1 Tax=Smittium simulii TaxID=133385 RepID=A0A2T9XZ71_9FUNG|nr:hypothetical protein BB561_006947 [Smittium simulii]